MNGTCQTVQQCANTGQSCATAACCSGLTCMAGTCMNTSGKKAFGQAPCTVNTDCTTNICAGFMNVSSQYFCSADCTNSATCAQLGGNYWCVQGGLCLRGCNSTTDCTDLGTDWSCDVSANIEGNMYVGLCGVWRNLAETEPCTQNDQCALGNCAVAWCQGLAGCGSDADCGTGKCAQITNGNYFCFPSCPTNDCGAYVRNGFTPTCKPGIDKDTTTVNICAP
jgi:hypothetical protein